MLNIKIYGLGSNDYYKLKNSTVKVCNSMGVKTEIEEIVDIEMFIEHKIERIPSLVIGDQILNYQSVEQIEEELRKILHLSLNTNNRV